MKTKIYPLGSFANDGWRDEFIEKFPQYDFDDPRNHNQSSIAKLVWSDMNSAMTCPISIVYLQKDKRAGTFSYSELGASRAMGNTIIAFDEDNSKEELISKIASHYTTSKKVLEHLLNGELYVPKFNPIKPLNKTVSHDEYKSILFAGDVYSGPMKNIINEMSKTKKVFVDKSLNKLDNFSKEIDLVVVNFDQGKPHDKKGLFFMGLSYALDIPILEIEGNPIIYPPLAGLARRTLDKPERFIQAEQYLKNLSSQHIEEEALVYYALMKKFN